MFSIKYTRENVIVHHAKKMEHRHGKNQQWTFKETPYKITVEKSLKSISATLSIYQLSHNVCIKRGKFSTIL